MRDDQDDDVPTRESYAWQPGEREAAYAEMAERQARIDARQSQIERDELLAWCNARKADASEVVTKSAPRTRHPEAAAAATASSAARQWQRYINRVFDKRQRILLSATAQVLKEERAAQSRINDELRDHIAKLERRLEALERQPGRRLRTIGE